MTPKRPVIIHLFDTLPCFAASTLLDESLNIVPVTIDQLIPLPEETVGIVLDVNNVTQGHCDLLQVYSTLSNGLGLCIVADVCRSEFLQSLSLLFHTVRFDSAQLSDKKTHENILRFFLSIAKTKNYNNSLKIHTHRTNTLETLGIIAHQWRQPINLISIEAINLMILANLDTGVKSSEVLKSSNLISEQTQRMANILKSILDIGQEQRAKSLFSINALLNTLKTFFTDQLLSQGIAFLTNPLEEDKQIYGFQTDLEEVLINLIANAKDAYQSVPNTSKKTIVIDVDVTKDNYVISVKDEAGGVEEQLQEKIFEPNFSTKEKGEGFGIGLHVARLIIEQEFKGSLRLKSHQSRSDFSITIPRTDVCNLTFIH